MLIKTNDDFPCGTCFHVDDLAPGDLLEHKGDYLIYLGHQLCYDLYHLYVILEKSRLILTFLVDRKEPYVSVLSHVADCDEA
jgi:hypothetical protein